MESSKTIPLTDAQIAQKNLRRAENIAAMVARRKRLTFALGELDVAADKHRLISNDCFAQMEKHQASLVALTKELRRQRRIHKAKTSTSNATEGQAQ